MITSQCKKFSLVMLALVLSVTSARAADDEGFTIRSLPLLVVYGGTVVLVIGAVRLGFSLGRKRYDSLESKSDPTVSPVTGALMGLLAFILAFTFNVSMSRFEMRKALYLDQVDAIENFFRRADLLPDKYRTVIQDDLIRYTDLRVATIGHPEKIQPGIVESDKIHNKLWKLLQEMGQDSAVSSSYMSLTTNSLTELVAVHNKRVVVTIIYHLPTPLWAALYALVIMAMISMGYMFGMSTTINWTLVIILSFSFSAVIILVSDLDRSGAGADSIIKFSQHAMIFLRDRLEDLRH